MCYRHHDGIKNVLRYLENPKKRKIKFYEEQKVPGIGVKNSIKWTKFRIFQFFFASRALKLQLAQKRQPLSFLDNGENF